MADQTRTAINHQAVLTVEIMASALDRRADNYAIDLENAITASHPRSSIVEKARLLVTCHDMWREAVEALENGSKGTPSA